MSIAGSIKKGAGALERALAKEGAGGRLSKAESKQLRIFKQDSAHQAKVAAKQSIIDEGNAKAAQAAAEEAAKKARFDHDTDHLAKSAQRHEEKVARRSSSAKGSDGNFKQFSENVTAQEDAYSKARVVQERSHETNDQRRARISARGKTSQEFVDNQRGRTAEGYRSAVDDVKFESTIAGGIGMDPQVYSKLSRDEKLKNIGDWGNTPGDVNLMDSLKFHRAPEAVLGFGVTGATVLGLSGSRGRQTNSQLYSQR